MVLAPLPTQQIQNVKTTSYKSRCDVTASHRRPYDVVSTLGVCWVGYFENISYLEEHSKLRGVRDVFTL